MKGARRAGAIPIALAIIAALCAGSLVAFLALRERGATRGRRIASRPEQVQDWHAYAAGGHRIGPTAAAVVITEFSDFQCPFCRRLSKVLRSVRARHASDVAIVYRHFPLQRPHRYARTAALAAECAGAQGRFEEYHDVLYAHQRALGRISWTQLATQARVRDTSAFSRCVRDSTYVRAVQADVDAGRRLQVTGTPTVLVNSWRLHGPATVNTLEKLIARELADSAARR